MPEVLDEDNRQTTRAAMAECYGTSAYPAALFLPLELDMVIGYEAIIESAYKCMRGVKWKYSTQYLRAHLIEKTYNLANDLASGRYREGKTHPVHLTFPKKREAIAIPIIDRIFQRSLNDKVLYPIMTRSLIPANMACQKGKGTDAAREYWKAKLHSAYLAYGPDFVIVTIDFKDYYGSMRHDVTNAMFRAKVPQPFCDWAIRTLDRQYKGDKGYNPGSQMVQIAGICYLDKLDHFAKERLHVKFYVHYMDDTQAAMRPEDANTYLEAMGKEAAKVGLRLHPTKTRIVKASEGALFLGFIYRVKPQGKVLMLRDPKKVKETRRRMRRLAHKIQRDEAPRDALDVSYSCVRACLEKGDSKRLMRRMDSYFNELKGEIENGKEVQTA